MGEGKFVSVKVGIEEYLNLTGDKGRIDRSYLKKLSNDIVRKLTYKPNLRHVIKIVDVDDYRVDLGEDFHSIVQVAYKDTRERKIKRTEIVEWMQKTSEGCDLVISLECDKCHKTSCECDSTEIVVDVDKIFKMSHPELFYGNMKHYYRHGGLTNTNKPISPYHPEFYVIKYATSSLHGADYHIKGCLNLERRLLGNVRESYVIEDARYLRLNVREGQVLLSYFEYKVDEEGYRLVPDIVDIFEAIKWYIEEMITYKEGRTKKDNFSMSLSERARLKKLEAIGRARSKLKTWSFPDFWAFIENHYSKVVPYDSWNENFNSKQSDRYGDDMSRLTSHN